MAKRISRKKISIMIFSLVFFVGGIALLFSNIINQQDTDDHNQNELDLDEEVIEEVETIGEFQAHMQNLFEDCYRKEQFDETRMNYGLGTFYINITLSEEDRERRVGFSSDCTEEYFSELNFSVNLTYFDLDNRMYQRLFIE